MASRHRELLLAHRLAFPSTLIEKFISARRRNQTREMRALPRQDF
jgi:hypothetical protein